MLEWLLYQPPQSAQEDARAKSAASREEGGAVGSLREIRVAHSLSANAAILARLYHAPKSRELKLRHFACGASKRHGLMLAYLDGMVDQQLAASSVLEPLMLLAKESAAVSASALLDAVRERFLPVSGAECAEEYEAILTALGKGGAAVFVEGAAEAILLEVPGYPMRAVSAAAIEGTVRGAQAAFTESMRSNIAQVRMQLFSSDLVVELRSVGRSEPKECALLSLSTAADPALVEAVLRWIETVELRFAESAELLVQSLGLPRAQFPHTLTTERPDRTAQALQEGRVVLLVEGDPFAVILPAVLWDFFHSMEDRDMRVPGAVFLRGLRYLGALVTLFLPAFYIAVTYFHQEAIPSEILFVIAGYRQMVPFPSLAEMLILILAFEFIREATLRVPQRLSGSISIVGAIILGQAAVTAKLVSPVLVVVVALTGLASYILPEYRFAMSLRIMQYLFLGAAAAAGLVGVAIVSLFVLLELAGMHCFGIPFLSSGTKSIRQGGCV